MSLISLFESSSLTAVRYHYKLHLLKTASTGEGVDSHNLVSLWKDQDAVLLSSIKGDALCFLLLVHNCSSFEMHEVQAGKRQIRSLKPQTGLNKKNQQRNILQKCHKREI